MIADGVAHPGWPHWYVFLLVASGEFVEAILTASASSISWVESA